MKLSKAELNNLISMFSSSDSENHVIAFQAIENSGLTVPELILLFKYSKKDPAVWNKQAPKSYKVLLPILSEQIGSLSSARVLGLLTTHKVDKLLVELFIENFVRDLTSMLGQIGYDMNQISIDVKIKDDGQSTES
tara:strand:- start:453 stop:860 length:408 start_codon:yes stop_codon:yes gene_type:complete